MRDLADEIRYGFSLYPFAVVIAVGVMVSGTGPALVRSLLSGMTGIPLYQALLVSAILVMQVLGVVVTTAGVFGALYTIIRDAKE